jgi:hypothetical protein
MTLRKQSDVMARYFVPSPHILNSHILIDDANTSNRRNSMEDGQVFKPIQYRAKAGEYGDLANASSDLQERVLCESSNRRSRSLLTMRSGLQTTTKTVRAEQDQVVSTALPMPLKGGRVQELSHSIGVVAAAQNKNE